MEQQLTINDLDISVEDIPDKYKKFVKYNFGKATVYYPGFNWFPLANCLAIDNTINTVNRSAFDVMSLVIDVRGWLMFSNRKDGVSRADEFYAFMYEFYGFSKTYVKNIQRVYSVFFEYDVRQALLKDFASYTFNQLVEIVSIPFDKYGELSPTMSIKQLRAFKKFLKNKDEAVEAPKQNMLTDSVDNAEEQEDTVLDVGVSRNYLSNVLVGITDKILIDSSYEPKTTSYKIFKKGVLEAFREFEKTTRADSLLRQLFVD